MSLSFVSKGLELLCSIPDNGGWEHIGLGEHNFEHALNKIFWGDTYENFSAFLLHAFQHDMWYFHYLDSMAWRSLYLLDNNWGTPFKSQQIIDLIIAALQVTPLDTVANSALHASKHIESALRTIELLAHNFLAEPTFLGDSRTRELVRDNFTSTQLLQLLVAVQEYTVGLQAAGAPQEKVTDLLQRLERRKRQFQEFLGLNS
jgi:hypothetical protein